MLGKPPQSGEVHDVTTSVAGAGQPCVDARRRAEQPLVVAGVYDVVPHVRDRNEKVRNFVTRRRRLASHDPRQRAVAAGAAGCHEQVGLVGQQVRKRERVPRAASPPERVPAHDREAEGDRAERMRHDDAAEVVEDDVAGGSELAQADDDVVRFGVDESRQLVERRRVTVLREGVVDAEPQPLQVQRYFFDFLAAGFLADFGFFAVASMWQSGPGKTRPSCPSGSHRTTYGG